MKSVNNVILLGNATRDAELKTTAAGLSVCTFGLATNREWTAPNGEKHSLAEFHNLVAWNGLADLCAKYVKKGKPLYIEGYLRTSALDRRDGGKDHRTEIVVEEIVLLGLSPKAA